MHFVAHFVAPGIPAHLKDAPGASVAVDESSALQSKGVITREVEHWQGYLHPPPLTRPRSAQKLPKTQMLIELLVKGALAV